MFKEVWLKMEKEFKSLSELEGWVGEKPNGFAIYRAKHIKEFIKKVNVYINECYKCPEGCDKCLKDILNFIKERAGPKLICWIHPQNHNLAAGKGLDG